MILVEKKMMAAPQQQSEDGDGLSPQQSSEDENGISSKRFPEGIFFVLPEFVYE